MAEDFLLVKEDFQESLDFIDSETFLVSEVGEFFFRDGIECRDERQEIVWGFGAGFFLGVDELVAGWDPESLFVLGVGEEAFAGLRVPADAFAAFSGDELEQSWGFAGVDDEVGSRPIGEDGGTGTCVHPIAGFPIFGISEVGFGGMMDGDGGTIVPGEDGVKLITQEVAIEFIVFDIAA